MRSVLYFVKANFQISLEFTPGSPYVFDLGLTLTELRISHDVDSNALMIPRTWGRPNAQPLKGIRIGCIEAPFGKEPLGRDPSSTPRFRGRGK